MSKKKKNPTRLKRKLLDKYRLVVLNEETFEERISIKLTRLNVFVLASLSTIILIALTTILIAFTPLREYIPGYSSTALKKKATELSYKTDSLQKVIEMNERYYASIKKVLQGDVSAADFNRDSIIEAVKLEASEVDLNPTPEDSLLRQKVDKEDKYNLFESATSATNFVLFPPANGPISEPYNVKDKHYAVDIVVAKDSPIKSTADGVVIFSEWTATTGYVIIIEHSYGLISVYKHNASLTKTQGELVKAGEVIATA
ncbi:MAG: M23 family metallopeptidase, partial [Flavobacteriia bacterium]|nr:M23 family metallopeptidase [Flavobacteriia bacterium]NCT14401.1 M23 family metallopeptidase [Flavobacteriales bacterium]